MSRLANWQIEQLAIDGAISPFKAENINSASLKIRLGYNHKIVTPQGFCPLDFSVQNSAGKLEINENSPYIFFPNTQMIVTTLEKFALPKDIEGQFFLSNNNKREFVQLVSPQYIPPGYGKEGANLVLQLINSGFDKVELYPGKIIGELRLDRLDFPEKINIEELRDDKNQKILGFWAFGHHEVDSFLKEAKAKLDLDVRAIDSSEVIHGWGKKIFVQEDYYVAFDRSKHIDSRSLTYFFFEQD